MAALDMSPKPGKAVVENDAGSYIAWSGADQPAVAGERLGCGLLVLKPLGLALPHYADSPKFGYVLGGGAVVGVLPAAGGAGERVVRLAAGDVITVRAGDVTWWYNDNDTDGDGDGDVSILFMGDTAAAISPGDITYFLLAGAISVLGGLDARMLGEAWGAATPEQAATAVHGQPSAMLTKLGRKLRSVCPREHDRDGLVVNAGVAPMTGRVEVVTAAHLPALGEHGFSVGLARLAAGAVQAPWLLRSAAAQAVYVARGSGRVQVASAGGATLLDAEVAAGSLLVVPRFAVACAAAGAGGMELVSLIKTPRPTVEHLAGVGGSVVGGLTPQVVEAALNVSPELVELVRVGGPKEADV